MDGASGKSDQHQKTLQINHSKKSSSLFNQHIFLANSCPTLSYPFSPSLDPRVDRSFSKPRTPRAPGARSAPRPTPGAASRRGPELGRTVGRTVGEERAFLKVRCLDLCANECVLRGVTVVNHEVCEFF